MPDDAEFIVAFNPKAGAGRSAGTMRTVTGRLDRRIARIIETAVDGTFAPLLRQWVERVRAQRASPPVVVCVGGDGTVSLVLNALERVDDATIAVVPCGSGNDFAAALGIGDPRTALEVLDANTARRIDHGTVNARRFANCVGMGLDAEVGALAARLRSRGFPPGASYSAAALAALFTVRPVGVTIVADGRTMRFDDGVMVTVGNGPSYGGGYLGAPDARVDDGALDCFAFSNVNGVFARLALMRRIRAGTHPSQRNVHGFRSAAFGVEFEREVAMHVDGELSSITRAEIAVQRGALRIVAPPPTA